jgi:hypothetical protein
MKKIIALSLTIFLALFLILVPSLFISSRPYVAYTSQKSYFNSLTQNNNFTFTFTSIPNKSLNTLTFFLKNPQILNNSQINFTISNGQEERSLSFSGSNIGDPSNLYLKFQPLKPTGFYTVSIETNNSTNETLFILADFKHQPIFNSTYYQSGFINRLQSNLQQLNSRFKHIQPQYKYSYIAILLIIFILL